VAPVEEKNIKSHFGGGYFERKKIEYIFEKVTAFRNRIFSKKGVMPINQGDEIQFKEFHSNKKKEKVMKTNQRTKS
jgi:hypothetical protein